jgi:hypothetical protein
VGGDEVTRVSDWEAKLSDYIASMLGEPFVWGVNDCCTFSAGAVEAITGIDPIPEYRGKYDTALGSVRALGGKKLEQVMDDKFPELPIGFAQRGDLAMMDGCVGVVMGDYALFVSEDGLERIKRPMWDKAWSVGRG